MNLLGAILYDPGTAVNKVTTSAIAMTAIDTTNLRLAITVPAHGKVRFRLGAVLHGATTFPSILLGVMNGAAIVGRVSPQQTLGNTAVATARINVLADFVATGLTPGALNCDAAYGVEVLIAATGLKFGGPNDSTANNAFGGFQFEAWDPQPLPTAAPGAANGLQIAGSNAATSYASFTANITGNVSGSVGSVTGAVGSVTGAVGSVTGAVGSVTAAVSLPSIPANWITAAGINASAMNGKGDWLLSSGYTAPPTAVAVADQVWDEVLSGHLTAGTTGAALNAAGAGGDPWSTALPGAYGAGTAGKIIGDKIVASVTGAVGSVTAGVTLAAVTHTGAVIPTVSAVTGLTASNLDATVSSRMATYTQPTGFLAATFPTGTVANTTNITAGTITTATNLTNAPTAGDLTATMKTSVTTAATAATPTAAAVTGAVGSVTAGVTVTTNNDKTGYGLSSAAVQAIWDALTSALTAVGSIGKKLADWTIGAAQTGDSFARLGSPTGASVSADVAAVKADTAAVKVQTDKLTFTVANQIDANTQSINDVTVNGVGTVGNPWGP